MSSLPTAPAVLSPAAVGSSSELSCAHTFASPCSRALYPPTERASRPRIPAPPRASSRLQTAPPRASSRLLACPRASPLISAPLRSIWRPPPRLRALQSSPGALKRSSPRLPLDSALIHSEALFSAPPTSLSSTLFHRLRALGSGRRFRGSVQKQVKVRRPPKGESSDQTRHREGATKSHRAVRLLSPFSANGELASCDHSALFSAFMHSQIRSTLSRAFEHPLRASVLQPTTTIPYTSLRRCFYIRPIMTTS